MSHEKSRLRSWHSENGKENNSSIEYHKEGICQC